MKKSAKTKLEIPAESSNEGFARVFAAAYSARLDPTMEELADIRTVISEAVTNAVVHAYPERRGTVHITAQVIDDEILEFTVKDTGRGIDDVEQAMEPMFTTGGEERSGMGFTIMQSFTDRLTVRSAPGKGTTVRFRKRIRRKR
ncbi:MAG: anti-sigma F factor [Oscillospiraceae bacterium]|jgi:stage II sporulation protein AB (anti-sigma F factor)|nr:anti-sigma F factor [Oscillospiraceae bacterium]